MRCLGQMANQTKQSMIFLAKMRPILTDETSDEASLRYLKQSRIALDAQEKVDEFSSTDQFRRYPWRKKVKIIAKEFDKFCHKNGVGGCWYIPLKEWDFRKRIINIFLTPIRAKVECGTEHPNNILLTGITNKEGSFLTRNCKPSYKYFRVNDLRNAKLPNTLTKKKRKIKVTEIPFFIEHPIPPSFYWWKAFDYYEWLNEKRK